MEFLPSRARCGSDLRPALLPKARSAKLGLRADREAALPSQDVLPTGREEAVSCGAAVRGTMHRPGSPGAVSSPAHGVAVLISAQCGVARRKVTQRHAGPSPPAGPRNQ